MRHVIVRVMVEHVAQHERRAWQPRRPAHRGQVRLQHEVAIALFPARRLVAGNRLHIDIVGKKIVAAVRFLVRAVDEELGVEALAHEAALHVGERRDHRVDLARRNFFLELREAEVAGHGKENSGIEHT